MYEIEKAQDEDLGKDRKGEIELQLEKLEKNIHVVAAGVVEIREKIYPIMAPENVNQAFAKEEAPIEEIGPGLVATTLREYNHTLKDLQGTIKDVLDRIEL